LVAGFCRFYQSPNMEDNMTTIRTYGRLPTFGEMKEYYGREDVLDFLYDECQIRNIDIAFRRKRWPIKPTSKSHLKEIIDKTIKSRIEKAYKNVPDAIDTIRLEKFDYLSFHSRTSITSGRKLTGFDMTFEADMQGWRRSFEDLCGVIKLLDDFEVCYRMKYSGVRSLHFMIPFESLPKQFNGESVLSQRAQIQSKIGNYFRRHCGMEKAHGGGVIRLAYSLNEDNGLVSLPLSSDKLPDFRPWETNIYNVTVDKPWHGDIPAGASKKILKFLREVDNDDAKAKNRKSGKITFGLGIVPKERAKYAIKSDEYSVEKWAAQLKSDDEAARIEAAWNLMTTPESVPISILKDGLADEHPDVRWYLTEALQKRLDDDAISLAGKMLWDEDQFVRISAIDALVLSGENSLHALSNSIFGDTGSLMGVLNDVAYAICKIRSEEGSEAIQSFIESSSGAVARFLDNTMNSDQPFWRVRWNIRQIGKLCKQYGIMERVLFRDTIKLLVPQMLESISTAELENYHIWILQDIRRNDAMPLFTMHEIADSLGINEVKIPSNRMGEEERAFLRQVVRESLAQMTLEQKMRILGTFWLRYKQRLSEPAGRLLLHIDISTAAAVIEQGAIRKIWAHRLKSAMELLKQFYPSAAESLTEYANEASMPFIGESKRLTQEKDIDELIEMLGQNWRIRTTAAYTLAEKCNSDEDVEKVVGVLTKRNTKTRTAAVKALGAMSHPRAREAIREALNARYSDVRRTALAIYVRSHPPDAIDILFHAVDEWRSVTGKHDAVRELGRYMDDERVLNKLREISADERFPLRARMKAERLLQRVQ